MQDERADGRGDQDVRDEPEAGGEAACFAQMLCPECGVVLDGSPHRADCKLGGVTERK